MYNGNENIVICDHPLVKHKITMLRDKNTGTNEFRAIVEEIAMLIGYEALRDLELEDAMIVLNSITVNDEFIDKSKIFLTSSGTVLLKGYEDKTVGNNLKVSYVYGLEMHQIHNRDDIKLYNELYTVEGK